MKISVITVCFNAAKTIGKALDSVATQTHPDVEHIVIDGGSRDSTVGVIRQMGWRVARLVSEPDRGIYDAMNKGLRLASGDVVGFLNADDMFADEGVLSLVAAALTDHSVDACYGDLCYVDPGDVDRVIRYWRSSSFREGAFATGWVPPHPTFYVRRKVYLSEGGFDISYRLAADFEIMLRLLEVRHIRSRYLPRVMVRMRLGGATNQSWRNVLHQNREIIRALRQHGVSVSLPRLVASKAASRATQFVRRPA